MRGSGRQIAGNPVLIGAATVLVVLVAVFLAYNANQGLPFVPTYNLDAQLPSAANLVRGNEVRIGGTRVGSIDRISVERREDGQNIALLSLKLERSVDPLPVDSTLIVRPRSALGLKYLQIARGTSDEGFEDGATIPLAQRHSRAGRVRRVREHVRRRHPRGRAREPQRVRRRARGPRHEHQPGDRRVPPAAARRHPGRTQPRQPRDRPAALRPLARPHRRDRRAGGRGAGAAVRQPRRDVRRPAQVAPFIQESITEGPATLDAGIEQFPQQRPFLANTAALFRELQPGAEALLTVAPDLADTVEVGTPVLRRSPPFNRRLGSLLESVERVRRRPARAAGHQPPDPDDGAARPDAALRRAGADDLQLPHAVLPQHRLAPLRGRRQRHLAAVHHRRDAAGPEQRGRPASAPANGPIVENHLHSNPTRTRRRRASRRSARRATSRTRPAGR